jgi:hypothetical protein
VTNKSEREANREKIKAHLRGSLASHHSALIKSFATGENSRPTIAKLIFVSGDFAFQHRQSALYCSYSFGEASHG